ncbi:MAG: type II secretion system protein [[Clostridium] innocuum]
MHLNKKGMTLIEVIVVLLLSSILMVISRWSCF